MPRPTATTSRRRSPIFASTPAPHRAQQNRISPRQLLQQRLASAQIFEQFPALGAPCQMPFQPAILHIPFHIQRNQRLVFLARHERPRKIFRIFSLRADTCDRTVASLDPRISATSCVGSPSRSRKRQSCALLLRQPPQSSLDQPDLIVAPRVDPRSTAVERLRRADLVCGRLRCMSRQTLTVTRYSQPGRLRGIVDLPQTPVQLQKNLLRRVLRVGPIRRADRSAVRATSASCIRSSASNAAASPDFASRSNRDGSPAARPNSGIGSATPRGSTTAPSNK